MSNNVSACEVALERICRAALYASGVAIVTIAVRVTVEWDTLVLGARIIGGWFA